MCVYNLDYNKLGASLHLHFTEKKYPLKRIMKAWSRVLAAIALSISLILSSLPCGSRAVARPIAKGQSSSASKTASSSQAAGDLKASRKTPYKQLGSCFRRIPPSTSNPTQNK